MSIDVIYCAGGKSDFAAIATAAGLRYGCQIPGYKPYAPLYFADQNWKNPDRTAYMAALALHRPALATVLDWEMPEQRNEVLGWAEEAAQYVDHVLIIPKCQEAVDGMPRRIGGKNVILAYSVPTSYGGCPLPIMALAGWPVHLLGGNPLKQRTLAKYGHWDVVSLDGNYVQRKALHWGDYLMPNGRWGRMHNMSELTPQERSCEAFRRSCEALMTIFK